MKYQDLLIQDKDLVLDDNQVPQMLSERASIAQDIKHMIMELNLFVTLIGNRSVEAEQEIINRLTLLVDADPRIVAGSSQVLIQNNQYWVVANTIEYGEIEIEL